MHIHILVSQYPYSVCSRKKFHPEFKSKKNSNKIWFLFRTNPISDTHTHNIYILYLYSWSQTSVSRQKRKGDRILLLRSFRSNTLARLQSIYSYSLYTSISYLSISSRTCAKIKLWTHSATVYCITRSGAFDRVQISTDLTFYCLLFVLLTMGGCCCCWFLSTLTFSISPYH